MNINITQTQHGQDMRNHNNHNMVPNANPNHMQYNNNQHHTTTHNNTHNTHIQQQQLQQQQQQQQIPPHTTPLPTPNNNNSSMLNNVINYPTTGVTGGWTRTISSYLRVEQIGEGTYGQVYKAIPLHPLPPRLPSDPPPAPVALKKIRVHNQSQGLPLTAIREIKILKALRHRNIVSLIEVACSKGCEYLDEEDEREDDRRKRVKEEEEAAKQQEQDNNASNAASLNNNSTSGLRSAPHSGGPVPPPPSSGSGDAASHALAAGNLFLCLSYAPHDLTGLMDMSYRFTPTQTKYIFRQLLDALTHLHGLGYIHRDLKVRERTKKKH